MVQLIKLLQRSPEVYMASVGQDGKPHVRPFALAHTEDNRLFFCTSKQGGFYDDIKYQPFVEISVVSPDYKWVRLSGEMAESENKAIKAIILNHSDIVKNSFQTVDNPNFLLFELVRFKAVLLGYGEHSPQIIQA